MPQSGNSRDGEKEKKIKKDIDSLSSNDTETEAKIDDSNELNNDCEKLIAVNSGKGFPTLFRILQKKSLLTRGVLEKLKELDIKLKESDITELTEYVKSCEGDEKEVIKEIKAAISEDDLHKIESAEKVVAPASVSAKGVPGKRLGKGHSTAVELGLGGKNLVKNEDTKKLLSEMLVKDKKLYDEKEIDKQKEIEISRKENAAASKPVGFEVAMVPRKPSTTTAKDTTTLEERIVAAVRSAMAEQEISMQSGQELKFDNHSLAVKTKDATKNFVVTVTSVNAVSIVADPATNDFSLMVRSLEEYAKKEGKQVSITPFADSDEKLIELVKAIGLNNPNIKISGYKVGGVVLEDKARIDKIIAAVKTSAPAPAPEGGLKAPGA
jgi:hypothetical protein